VRGSGLGAQPAPAPDQHPAGLNGCPAIANNNGYDYGTSLYLAVPSHNWSAGRSTGNETDCIDLVVTKFTTTEVDFHLGPFYTQSVSKFPLTNGTQLQVTINGAQKTVHVNYGAAATS
jgi:hypothetical protein